MDLKDFIKLTAISYLLSEFCEQDIEQYISKENEDKIVKYAEQFGEQINDEHVLKEAVNILNEYLKML